MRPEDQVVELAPLGTTAALALACMPLTYTGDLMTRVNVDQLRARPKGPGRRFPCSHAAHTGIPGSSVDKVYGAYAHHACRPPQARRSSEAYRILKPGGSYAIYELGLTPPGDHGYGQGTPSIASSAQTIRVNARPLTAAEWEELLLQEGFQVRWQRTAAMRLLEPGRMIADEGLLRTLRIAWNIVRRPAARGRVLTMRRVFRRYREHINALAFVAVKA
ncbi:MAG: class I SAM-dependent methyltransferase [Flavobacteriales bacterium]